MLHLCRTKKYIADYSGKSAGLKNKLLILMVNRRPVRKGQKIASDKLGVSLCICQTNDWSN